jgi:ribonuclease P protein component
VTVGDALGPVLGFARARAQAPVTDQRERSVPERSYPASVRLKRRPDFSAAQGRGRKIHTEHFVVCLLVRKADPTSTERPARLPPDDGPRLGITVTKKIAGAVGRNRVKRVVREVFRCNRSQFPSGTDVVVIAKDGAPSLSRAEVERELLEALSRRRRA